MMLQFIVLGLVPGTHLQITFEWFLAMGMIIDVLFGVFFVYMCFKHNSPTTIQPDSGTAFALLHDVLNSLSKERSPRR